MLLARLRSRSGDAGTPDETQAQGTRQPLGCPDDPARPWVTAFEGLRQERGRRVRRRGRDGRSSARELNRTFLSALGKREENDAPCGMDFGRPTCERFFDYVTLSHLRQGLQCEHFVLLRPEEDSQELTAPVRLRGWVRMPF